MNNQKRICVFILIMQLIICTGCNNNNKSEDNKSSFVDVSDYLSKTITAEGLKSGRELKNINISPECYIRQPKDVKSVREFNWSSPKAEDNNEFIKQFKQTYKYLFGDGFEEDCFFVISITLTYVTTKTAR